jgi:long-chain acyl-CoA synthetase
VDYVYTAVTETARNEGLKGFEIAKKIRLHHNSFVGYGIFTSTLKMQRHIAKQVFLKDIHELYSN